MISVRPGFHGFHSSRDQVLTLTLTLTVILTDPFKFLCKQLCANASDDVARIMIRA